VFELTPPSTAGGTWTKSILWSFGNGTDGANVLTDLIFDSRGNLFGTTAGGGTYGGGTAFELTPAVNAGGPWTESILWSFGNGTDGSGPVKGMTMDSSGNLYGTTEEGGAYINAFEGGTVFELTPPATIGGNWTELVLWSFGNGTDGMRVDAGVIVDKGGNLYGTTLYGGANINPRTGLGFGTVFELTPPTTNGGNWTESILWSAHDTTGNEPEAGLIMDASGNLYGTTLGGGAAGKGTVFEISSSPTIPPTKLTASPGKLNFGNIKLTATSKPKKVTLTNKGTIGVGAQISTITATAPFTIAGGANTCSGETIARKKTCSFYVEFAPTTLEKRPDLSL